MSSQSALNPHVSTAHESPEEPPEQGGSHAHDGAFKLALGALGVVYGDIGTSPLYAIKECFARGHGVDPTPLNVLGVLSLIVWSLILVVVVKYIAFILRADNDGEGGILALLALVLPKTGERNSVGGRLLIALGLFGAALLYGDGVITPAISVLSAVEGLEVATTGIRPLVLPITVAILVGLFGVQRRGTAGVGAVFGPATLVWFVCIAAAGLPWILRRPEVLGALNPVHALRFFQENHLHGFFLLGSVVLCITGGEALYADMGHFGRAAIRRAWFFAVFPALLCNYFGQGAALLERGEAIRDNPFFGLVSSFWVYPLVAVATVATVVASQALISGAFSLTQQAVQLGYCPRVSIVHTSGTAAGQIYVPEVNKLLMVVCVALVITAKESSKLAGAYGIAVTGTMAITSVLFFQLTRARWRWPLWKSASLAGLFLSIDLAFFGANIVKFTEGGWFPIAVAAAIFAAMTTWKKGRERLAEIIRSNALPLAAFLDDVQSNKPLRVPGTAVFMTSSLDGTPPALLHHFKHNKMLHQQLIFLSVESTHAPEVPDEDRLSVAALSEGFWRVEVRYGFMESPNVPEALARCARFGLSVDPRQVSYYLGRESLLTTGHGGMAAWRKTLFVFLSRNAQPAGVFFGLPPNRVIELGAQITL